MQDGKESENRVKAKEMIQAYNESEERLSNIMRVMNGLTFGLRYSARIVGGRGRLERLIIDGKIRADKGNMKAQNGKWQCNASDVLKYAMAK